MFHNAKRVRFANLPAIQSGTVYLLFNRVTVRATPTLETSIWHFGWGSVSFETDRSKAILKGAEFVQQGATWGFLRAPDENLVEINDVVHRGGEVVLQNSTTFTHVHLFSEWPLCAAEWYQDVLGAARVLGRGERIPADCHVLSNVGVPGRLVTEPNATVRLVNGVDLIIYPKQDARALVSPTGHVIDHIAVSYPSVRAALARVNGMHVRVLDDVGKRERTGRDAAMIEGPDLIRIELIEQSATPAN